MLGNLFLTFCRLCFQNSAIRATADAAKNLEDCASDGLTIVSIIVFLFYLASYHIMFYSRDEHMGSLHLTETCFLVHVIVAVDNLGCFFLIRLGSVSFLFYFSLYLG